MQHDSARPVALVTGAARRIGAVIARTLHAADYDLALHCRTSYAELESLVAELEINRRDSTIALQAELGDTDSLPDLVDATAPYLVGGSATTRATGSTSSPAPTHSGSGGSRSSRRSPSSATASSTTPSPSASSSSATVRTSSTRPAAGRSGRRASATSPG